MNLFEIFKDSFMYPSRNLNRVLVFWGLFLISSFSLAIVGSILGESFSFSRVGVFFITLLFIILLSGYSINIIKSTLLEGKGVFSLFTNLVDGIKVVFLFIVYYIVPLLFMILTSFSVFSSNIYSYLDPLFNFLGGYPGSFFMLPYNMNIEGLINSLGLQTVITTVDLISVLTSLILLIVFSVLFIGSKFILAKTNSLKNSLNIMNIFEAIKKIGFKKYILWFMIMGFSAIFIIEIQFLTIFIYEDGGIISTILSSLFVSYYIIFNSRAIGLLYKKYG